jgi:dienelactone hydrolase
MKITFVPSLQRNRKLNWFTAGLMMCIACLTCCHADQIDRSDLPWVSPLTDPLEVSASLFTEKTFDWFDSRRQRRVPARLYLPKTGVGAGGLPLVVFSHGIGGSKDGYSYLGRYFAAHGFASLHVQHVGSDRQIWYGNPLTLTSRLSAAAQESEALQRVKDLRYALDEVLVTPQGALLDTRRIVAAGHSYGANTTMLIAGAKILKQEGNLSLRDHRISAAILISAPPFYGMGDPEKILSGIDIPTLHITATSDVIQIPGYESGLQDRIDIFEATGRNLTTSKVLVVFKGGSHSIFTDRSLTGGPTLNPKVKIATRQLVLAFLSEVLAGNRHDLDAWQRRSAVLLSTFQKQML